MSARRRGRGRRRGMPLSLVGVFLAALGLVVLRVDIIRLRYQNGEKFKHEQALEERAQALTAGVRELRDPRELRRRAEQLGFAPPTRILHVGPDGATGDEAP